MCIDNYTTTAKVKCEDCNHGGLCIHRENFRAASDRAKEIEADVSPKLLSPITVEAKCRSFEPKPKARNGYSLSDLKRDLR